MVREQYLERVQHEDLSRFVGYCPLEHRSKGVFVLIPVILNEIDWMYKNGVWVLIEYPKVELDNDLFAEFGNNRKSIWGVMEVRGLPFFEENSFNLNELATKALAGIGENVIKRTNNTLSARNSSNEPAEPLSEKRTNNTLTVRNSQSPQLEPVSEKRTNNTLTVHLDKIRKSKRTRRGIYLPIPELVKIFEVSNRHVLYRLAEKNGVDLKNPKEVFELYKKGGI